MNWSGDAEYVAKQHPPKCWECHHYERKTEHTTTQHRCHIAMPGFPGIGNRCKAFIYEPGTDALEAYHD